MTCDNCVKHVTAALKSVAGVEQVDVKLDSGLAHVRHEPAASAEAMIAAVVEEGYTASVNTTTA